MKIDIAKFLKTFDEIYSWLYDYGSHDDVRQGAEAFGVFAEKHKDFIREFVEFRQDYISSDREAAAFMYALDEMVEFEW